MHVLLMQQELTSELILTFNVNLLVNVRCKHRTKQTLKLPRSKLFLMCFQACYNYYNVNCGNSTEQSKNEFKTFRALVHGIKHTAGSRPSSSVLVQCIYITYSFTECIYQYQLLVCMWLWLTWHKRVRHWRKAWSIGEGGWSIHVIHVHFRTEKVSFKRRH